MTAALIIIGLVLQILAWPTVGILYLVGMGLILFGCYRWATRKNRHWAFMFWGLLAPFGLLGIALLQDKFWNNLASTPEPVSAGRVQDSGDL